MDAKKYETPNVVMNNEKQQVKHMIAAREKFAARRKQVVHHTPNSNVNLTSASSLIKARIEFAQNRIQNNHLLSEIVENKLNRNKKVELDKIVAKMARTQEQGLSI